jgi:DNA modification methylase
MVSEKSKHSTNPSADSSDLASNHKFRRVTKIPRCPEKGESFYIESPDEHPSYTHYLFRFPAKFHPPVVSWALDTFGSKGTTVLDPFTGSGTVQVEALVRGMPSIGIDVDPLACFITRAKTTPLSPDELKAALDQIEAILSPFKRSDTEQKRLIGSDISDKHFESESQGLAFPAIPNMFHWFRRYVVVDLARVFCAIQEAVLEEQQTHFFRACAAAIIRRVSNADPSPVSGLEVTRIQAERNATREIKVFDTFVSKARKEIHGMHSLWDACGKGQSIATTKVVCGDVLRAKELLTSAEVEWQFPLIVTSPPYCTAVNYSRRHKLEMYWLGFIENPEQHIKLAHSYIGRRRIRIPDWDECGDLGIEELDQTLARITERNHIKARALRHYFWSMSRGFAELKRVMKRGGILVCAIGDSVCYEIPVATTRFIVEFAAQHFLLQNQFSYAVRNHYMQYPLRNNKGIREEYILVLKRQ